MEADAACAGDADMHAGADADDEARSEPSCETAHTPAPVAGLDAPVVRPASPPLSQGAAALPAARQGSAQTCIDAQPPVQGPLAEWAAQLVASFERTRAVDAVASLRELRTLLWGACSPLAVLEREPAQMMGRNAAAGQREPARSVVLRRLPAFDSLLQVRVSCRRLAVTALATSNHHNGPADCCLS